MISWRQLVQGWNRFFFEPESPTPIAVYRILLALLILVKLALLYPHYMEWFSPDGILPPDTARKISGGRGLSMYDYLPATTTSAWIIFWACVAAALSLLAGLWTRVSAALVFVLVVSMNHRNALIVNSGDSFVRIALFFLIFSQAGAAYSLDRLIRVARGKESGPPPPQAPWATRLIAIQVALLYLYTCVWKLMGGMWLDGTALYYTSRLQEFWKFPLPYAFEHMWTIKLATWGTLVLELALGILIWVKEFRPWVLLGGVFLHLGIGYTMNIPLFGMTMMAAYVTFLEPRELERFFAWVKAKWNAWTGFKAPVPVFYDGKCSFCIRTLAVVERLDTFGRFEFHDMHRAETRKLFPDFNSKQGEKEMLVRVDGQWLGGFAAFRFLARHMPPLWPLLPFLHLPKIGDAGDRVYKRVAERRYCLLKSEQ